MKILNFFKGFTNSKQQKTNTFDADDAPRIYRNVERPYFTPDAISELRNDEIFVFGSNIEGLHGGGAALIAANKFGAVAGKGVGLQGQSYAIPTMEGSLEQIKSYVDEFIAFARQHTEYFFYVTRIGCGIAGYKDKDIAPLFSDALNVENISLPRSFVLHINPKIPREIVQIMYGQVRTMVDILKVLNSKMVIKDADDAANRLRNIVEKNVRYGDAYAMAALRALNILIDRYTEAGKGVDIERLERDMIDIFKEEKTWETLPIVEVFYHYSAEKLVRYIKFLNDFRRYTDFKQIKDDLSSIPFSHCSSNDEGYYFSFDRTTIYVLLQSIKNSWEYVSKDGVLNNEALEQFIFGNYEELLARFGLRKTIKKATFKVLALGRCGSLINIKVYH
uniref:A1S_2505 family phage non-structural protein n=1 Tax=Prevotella aurantiaca TaxID=596085 RepID=UPI00046AE806|nr:hypothetical protein [Prevotella aurantiaca]